MSEAGQELDLRGLVCPEPIRCLKQAINQVPKGTLLTLLTDDPAAPIDIEAFCLDTGHRYLSTVRIGQYARSRVQTI